ncbi:TetR family transcriptional regulator [Rhodococcus sp. PSBB066]|nr:TetR/AcrR family transcriptional regulator [Rhodococcus aetherivorans]NCL76380.1 HTH-type transcriptional repressor KstR2 [Rhodococcus sp. YH1]PND51151.1 TetR/AcrR family transcriptional regulator [Rhodococcus sp. ENV425]QIX48994.1 TetR/AcrR family transcriptional regulator [Rhodococcus sp. DMU1]QSE59367.1 TetR family transcriptional regulator [Rhodococcus sp. PSBB066]QSE69310.1 TetR family transcriptional regulator [Rhodococcus sp. PSBB049]
MTPHYSDTVSTSERAPAAATRETILAAATALFGDLDYPATSIRDIARAVDMLPGSIYAYVESKEAILYEIVSTGIDRFVSAVESIDPATAPDERLEQAIRAHIDIVAENPQRALVVFHQWRYLGDESRAQVIAARRRYEEFFRTTIREGAETQVFRPDLDVRYATLTVLGALNWAPEWIHADDPARADSGRKLADILLAGLRPFDENAP